MSEWGREALEAWARDRGLRFEGEGLLPAATDLLREGLNAGSHRAGVIVSETAHSVTSLGGLGKKPERHTMNITRGRLPGGLEGVVGHHFHLEYRTSGDDDGWLAVPHTVVFAYVPEGARVTRDLKVLQGWPEGEPIDGYVWRTDPPESWRDVQEMARGIGALLAAAPDTVVEMRDGSLCVAARGVIEDSAQLDHLCRLASAVADGARRAAAFYAPLDPTAPTAAQATNPQLAWVEAAASTIAWSEPPASVQAAAAAYAGGLSGHRSSTSRRVSVIALMAVFAFGLIWFAVDALLAFAFDMPYEALIGAVIGVLGAPAAIHAALRFGRETAADDVAVRSNLPGLEAFAREYARSRGMALEDRDEFRRRFASPIPGAPLKVLYGSFGDGVSGRLVLWISRTDAWEVQYWNLAVLPAQADPVPVPGYRAERHGDTVVVGEPVPDEGRSVERLDLLRAAARQAVGATPAAQVPAS
jgi:hypothetical protein